jgi:4-hydroxyphenylpyruvate dioxygenase-like putative hemolysin
MIAVIVAMFLVILVPATVMTIPLSTIKLSITNTDPSRSVVGDYSIYGIGVSYVAFTLSAGETEEWTYKATAGSHTLGVHYVYSDPDTYYDYRSVRISVPFAGTEEVEVNLVYSSWWG